SNLTEFNGKLYFEATEAASGRELWVTDGTAAGTSLVYDFNTGTTSGMVNFVGAINVFLGKLVLIASSATTGTEIWTSDGTTAGTSLVLDVYPGTSSGCTTSSNSNCVAGARLFFYGNDGVTGAELWVTNGTPAGTVQVKDINTTSATASSSPANLTA